MDDTISRQEAIKEVRELAFSLYGYDATNIISCAINRLQNLPPAEPERKKGKWIDDTYCSICGWANEVESGFIGSVEGFNFCPNCGKEMEHD